MTCLMTMVIVHHEEVRAVPAAQLPSAQARAHAAALARAQHTPQRSPDAAEALDAEVAPQGTADDGALVGLDLSGVADVSGLLARLVDERIPMAMMLDLVDPQGPPSRRILEDERSAED